MLTVMVATLQALVGTLHLMRHPPADMDDAEPLQEDRVVPFSDDSETALADGILMTENCTLKVLRAGCSVLGLSSRGGKNTCLKRMVEHVRARWRRNQNAQ